MAEEVERLGKGKAEKFGLDGHCRSLPTEMFHSLPQITNSRFCVLHPVLDVTSFIARQC